MRSLPVRILEMIRFEHTVFALPLAFSGVFLASGGRPRPAVAGLVLLAMAGARSAAMAFNRYADASLDALNPRTRDRALPRGEISKRAALILVLGSSALFFGAAFLLNPLCFLLSPAALAVVLLYSYTKRFTAWCHGFLGLALALAPAGGWLAVTGAWSWKAAVLSPAVLLWVAGFDILYACLDIEFDRKAGLHSIPARLGTARALAAARMFHAAAWLLFWAAGWVLLRGWFYYAGVLGVGVLLVYEHRLVAPGDLTRLDRAFFTVNSWVSVVFFLGVLGDTVVG